MKQKDIVYLILAAAIFLVAGYVVFTQIAPKKNADGVQVDKIGKIPDQMDAGGIAALSDKINARDFSSPIEFSGLNNTAPFGR